MKAAFGRLSIGEHDFPSLLRDPSQRVSEKTNTGDAGAAIAAFSELVSRTELDGSRMLAVITKKRLTHRVSPFQLISEDENRYWRGRIEQLPIYFDAGRPAELEGGKRVMFTSMPKAYPSPPKSVTEISAMEFGKAPASAKSN